MDQVRADVLPALLLGLGLFAIADLVSIESAVAVVAATLAGLGLLVVSRAAMLTIKARESAKEARVTARIRAELATEAATHRNGVGSVPEFLVVKGKP